MALEVKVGADMAELLSKVDQAKAKINQMKESQEQLKKSVDDLNSSLKQNETELGKTATSLRKLVDSGKGATAEAKNLRAQLSGLATNSATLNTKLVETKTQLTATTAQIKTQAAEMKKAETATGGFAGGATKAFSALRTLANVIPGIGIGGLVAIIAGPLVEALQEWVTHVSAVTAAQTALKGAMAEAKGSAGGEIAQLQTLVSIASDTSLSYATRTQAIKELNKEYPGLHNNITLENINTAAVTDQINKEIAAIVRRAQVKGIEKLIDEESIKLEKAKSDTFEEQGNAIENVLDKLASLAGSTPVVSVSGVKAFTKEMEEGPKKIAAYIDKLLELNKESAKTGTLFVDTAKGKTSKVDQFGIDLQALEKNFEEVQKLRVQSLHANIDDYTKNGIAVTNILLNDQLDFLNKKNALLDKYNKSDFSNFKAIESAKQKLLTENLNFANTIKQPGFEATKKLVAEMQEVGKIDPVRIIFPTDEVIAAGIAQDKFNIKLAETGKLVNDILGPAFDALFTSIVEGSGNAFESFGQALTQVIKKLVVTVLKAVALGAIISLITGSPFNIGSIITKALTGYAKGGEVKGRGSSTSDSIPARLSAGEYVLKASTVKKIGVPLLDMINQGKGPTSFLNGFPKFAMGGFVSPSLGNIGGGQTIQVVGEFVLRGDKLVAAVQRGNAQINRNS